MPPELSRRDLLKSSALAAAAITSGALAQPEPKPPTPAPTAPKRTLRKAIMFGMCAEQGSLTDKMKTIRDAGFEGVEIDWPSASNGPTVDDWKKAVEASGVRIHGLVDSQHWGIPLNSPDDTARAKAREALESCLTAGKELGAISVLLVPAIVNKQLAYDHAWKLSVAEIRKAVPLARECGVAIAIENVWNAFLMSPVEAATYVDEIEPTAGAPASPVGFHFDIGNVINFGWPEQWVKVLGRRIYKLHIKDFSRKKRDDQGLWKGFQVELGEGDADWAAVMKALDEIGYSTDPKGRWATAEVRGGDRKRLKEINDQMDKLFAM